MAISQMQILGVGIGDGTEAQVDPTHSALRVQVRPTEHVVVGKIGGHYIATFSFSNTAGGPAANSQLLSVRWSDTGGMLMALKRLVANVAVTTAFTTAQAVDLQALRAQSFPNNPSANGTNIVLGPGNRSRTSNMGTSLFAGKLGDIQISNGAALTPGASQVLDAQPFGYGVVGATAVGVSGQVPLYEEREFGQHPQVFGPNEGFVVQNGIALGAAGVVKVTFQMYWQELPAY